MRSAVTAVFIILGACATMRPTRPGPYSIDETRTQHQPGTAHPIHPELRDP